MISLRLHIIRHALSMRRTTQLFVAAVVLLGTFVVFRVRRGDVGPSMGLLSLVWLASVAWLAVGVPAHGFGWSRSRKANIRLLVGATFGALLCLEVVLRVSVPSLATFSEVSGLAYRSQYHQDSRSIRVYHPGEQVRQPQAEFVHVRTANQLGLADREIPVTKAPDEYRILALGDSFTEGVGASEDATWVRVMQRELQARYPDRRVTTINAGHSGDDPFDEYAVFKDRLLPLRPDLVVVAMNGSDINEVLIRGGRDRFQPDGTVRFRRGPWWETVYALSYITRLLVHSGLNYNNYLIPNDRMPEELAVAAGRIRTAVEDIQRLCDGQGSGLLLVVHPLLEEMRGVHIDAYDAVMADLARNPRVRFVRLADDYALAGTMTPQNFRDFYWPLDRHHNERGYQIMGRAIAARVVDMGFLDRSPRADR